MNFNLTFIGQIIAFAIFVWFCAKFVWPPLIAAIDERQKKISDGLLDADRAERDLEMAQEKAAKILREARQEASTLVDAANSRGNKIIEEAKGQARTEADRIKQAAQAEVEQEVDRAKEKLRGQLAGLVIVGAEKVLESSVNESTHKDMIDKLAANL